MAFKCNFVDGPWTGQSVTYEKLLAKIEITRAGVPAKGTSDSMFVYVPSGPVEMNFGVPAQDYVIVYDGPITMVRA